MRLWYAPDKPPESFRSRECTRPGGGCFYFMYTKLPKKKIALLYAGGRHTDFANQDSLNRWARQFFEMQMVANPDPILISKKVVPGDVKRLKRVVRRIDRDWNAYDGFVVTVDASTSLFEAKLLESLFQSVGKPVVVTSAQPLLDGKVERSDLELKGNILNALVVATKNFSGVGVMYGSLLLEANDVFFKEKKDHVVVHSQTKSPMARVDFGVHLREDLLYRTNNKPITDFSLSDTVVFVDIRKDLNRLEELSFDDTVSGIVVCGGHTLQLSITQLFPAQLPVCILTSKTAYLYLDGSLQEVKNCTPQEVAVYFLRVVDLGVEAVQKICGLS